MFVGYRICHHRQKGSKRDKRALRSLNFIFITVLTLRIVTRLGFADWIYQGGKISIFTRSGFAKEDLLPAEDDKLPAEWDQLLWPHNEIACSCYNFFADLYWSNPWDCFPLIVSAADITGPTIKFDIFGKVQIESTLHLILTILFQSHNQSFYQLCKTSFILLRKNFWCCSSRVVS